MCEYPFINSFSIYMGPVIIECPKGSLANSWKAITLKFSDLQGSLSIWVICWGVAYFQGVYPCTVELYARTGLCTLALLKVAILGLLVLSAA